MCTQCTTFIIQSLNFISDGFYGALLIHTKCYLFASIVYYNHKQLSMVQAVML